MAHALSIDFLRTFVAIADAGSFAAAAERVGRSLSAVSLQMDKLESQTGQRLFEKSGRRMLPTPSGRDLLDHARTIIAANDAALAALSTDRLSGQVRLGLLHDVLETTIADVLSEFTVENPAARLNVTVDTSRALVDALERDDLDQAVAFEVETRAPSEALRRMPMLWVGAKPGLAAERRPIPLVLLDEPCAFRRAALAALDTAGIPWQVVLTSASLSAVRAAVAAGLGITVRTAHFLETLGPRGMIIERLPKLPEKRLKLYRRVRKITSRTGAALHAVMLERLRSGDGVR